MVTYESITPVVLLGTIKYDLIKTKFGKTEIQHLSTKMRFRVFFVLLGRPTADSSDKVENKSCNFFF